MAVLPPELMPELLARSSRPGAVEVAHVRRLASRYRDAFAPSPLLQRLLARRGEHDTAIASGALVLAVPPLQRTTDDQDHSPQPLPMVVAPARRVESISNADALPMAMARRPGAAAASSDIDDRAATNPAPDRRSGIPTLAHPQAAPVRAAVATSDRARQALAPPSPLPVARLLRGVDAAADDLPKRAPGHAATASERDGGTENAALPMSGPPAAALSPQARELPGPAIAADLLLPPNPLPTPMQRARRARVQAVPIEVDGQPVEATALPLVSATSPAGQATGSANDAPAGRVASGIAQARAPSAALQPQRSSVVAPRSMGMPSADPPADPRQLADQVARELTRSLRRARERKGMPPWTS